MKTDSRLVQIDRRIFSALLTSYLRCLEIIRESQIASGTGKRKAKPSRKQLTNMDYVVCQLLGQLVSNNPNLDAYLDQWEIVFEQVSSEIDFLETGGNERPIKLHTPDAIPKSSEDMYHAITKQGLSDSLSLSESLEIDRSTVGRQVEPLLTLNLVRRLTGKPLIGRRNWEYAYELTKRGRKAYKKLYNETPRVYNYKPGTSEYLHHLAVNICVYFLINFEPEGFYFGETAELVSLESTYGIKTELRADAVGWWGPRFEVGWWNPRYTYIEFESGANESYLDVTLKKFILSTVETLLVVFLYRDSLRRFLKRAENTVAEGKHVTDQPLEIYATTLQDVVDGMEPVLAAVKKRA